MGIDVVKGVKYVVTERNLNMGGEHTMQCIYALLLNRTLETYWISLISVTIKKKKIINGESLKSSLSMHIICFWSIYYCNIAGDININEIFPVF